MSRKYKTFLSEKEFQEEIDHLWDDIIISDEDVSELEDNVIEHNDTAPTAPINVLKYNYSYLVINL
ncbi:hypothetical protein C0J52_05879 [Blattella germanica]|nr:hypothetical protein C0J52_05879 [Blattella germanica]